MREAIRLAPDEPAPNRPFTDPIHLAAYAETLRYMAAQVCVLLEYPYLAPDPPQVIFFHRPDNTGWFHRIVLGHPDRLRHSGSSRVVGFFGSRRATADKALADDFDRILVAEIPAHSGLLSYSTMAMTAGNFANLVIFADEAARDHWRTSQAHAQAVDQLAPEYYETVTIVQGILPEGVFQHHDLALLRAKYYDYRRRPGWRAERELGRGP